jgi:hypothetical protein
MSCGKQMERKVSIEFHWQFKFISLELLGSSNLFLPAISKIWPAFGHWQPAISNPALD